MSLNISNFPWAECAITENRTLYVSDSVSLKRTKRSTGIHRYEFELVTIDMDMRVGRQVMAKLSAATEDTLLFVHPRLSYTMGLNPPSGIAVIGGASAGDNNIDVAGFGEQWQLMAGDYVQFGNHSKVYQVADDTTSSIGTKNIKLTSGLVESVSDTTQVIVDDITWHLSSDGMIEVGMQAVDNQDMQITLMAVEKL